MTVTIRDVAQEAGVSVSTVSRALSTPERVADTTLDRVRSAARSLGYHTNRNASRLATGHAETIGLIVPDLRNPFYGALCRGVQSRAAAAEFAVIVADTDENPEIEIGAARNMIGQVDGVVLCSPRSADEEVQALARDVPLVLTNRELAGIPSVSFDDEGGVRAIVGHLVALGHTRIAYVGGPRTSWANQQRHRVFLGLKDEYPGVELKDIGTFPPHFSGGVHAADLVLASGASAVVAYNDMMALGIMDRLAQRGVSVPDDLSVGGFDDVFFSTFVRPNLTTVRLSASQLGSAGAELLLRQLRDTSAATVVIAPLAAELIVRESTAARTRHPAGQAT